ncbi:hypothetical protein [Mycobacterium sp.]|uniref:hypothetical protein n=1 Tax=Mycobacterium sp. TaxID=1785 RepID=UPI002D00DCF0|nr:hypothetical protein [Mycobacterium sp.]HTQ16943.1 hypothetical protein [Mycobacterium sp.]
MPDPETDNSPPISASRLEPEGWVPADVRFLGLDRRTIAPTLVVFALAIAMSVVLPLVNAAVPYHDIVKAGDVMQLEGEVTFVPEAGWGITSGVRAGDAPLSGAYPPTAVVEHGALRFRVHTGLFEGDAHKLLDQIEATSEALNRGRGVRVTGAQKTIVTDHGRQGAVARVSGPHSGGVLVAFVFDGRGVEAVATGPTDISEQEAAGVIRMVRSINRAGEGQR